MRRKRDIDKAIGERVRQEREKAGWTRDKLAELLDCSTSYISELERGNTGLSITMLQQLCETVGVSADTLIWGPQEEPQNPVLEKVSHLDNENFELLCRQIQLFLETIAINKKKEAD